MGVEDKSSGGAGFRHHHALTGGQAGDADFAVLVRAVHAVAVAHNGAVRIQNLELGVLQGDGGIDGAYLSDKELAVRGVGEADGDHTLLTAVGQHDRFGGLDDVVPVRSVHFLQHIGPRIEARPHGGAVLAGDFGADDSAARAAGAAQVAQLERASGQNRAGDAIIFFDYDGVLGHVLKGDDLALAALDIKFLGGGLLDGVPSGGFQLRHLIPAVPQQVNEKLAVLVGEECPQAVQLAGGRVIGAVPNLELRPFDRTAGDAVHLVHGQGGLLVVLKINGVVAVGVERHKLAGGVHQPGGRDGLLAHLVHSGQEVGQGGPAVGVRLDFVYAVAVRRPDGKNGVRDGLAGVCVLFVDNEVGSLLIFQCNGAGLARKQLHMVLLQVQNVVGNGGSFLDGVHAGFQLGDVDLAVLVGDTVKVMGAVLNAGNPEMDAAQPGAVRAGLDKAQGGLGGVRENEIGVLVRVHLHHPHSVVHQVALRGLQLPDFIRAGGQLGQVNLAVNVRGELLPVAPAHQLELKADVGQGFHRYTIDLHQMDTRFQGIEKDQLPRLRVPGFQFDLLGSAVHHMGVVRGYLFHKVGAGVEVIQKNFAAGGGGVLPEQVAIVPYLKGYVRHGGIAFQVVLQNAEGGPCPIGDGQHGIVLGGRVIRVDVDAVGRLVQHIPGGGGGFHDLNIGFLADAGHAGLAVVVGGDGGNELAVREHIKGGVGQGNAGLLVHLDDGQADVPHVLPNDGHVFGAVPLHRFHTGGLHIAVRGRLLRNTVGAIG